VEETIVKAIKAGINAIPAALGLGLLCLFVGFIFKILETLFIFIKGAPGPNKYGEDPLSAPPPPAPIADDPIHETAKETFAREDKAPADKTGTSGETAEPKNEEWLYLIKITAFCFLMPIIVTIAAAISTDTPNSKKILPPALFLGFMSAGVAFFCHIAEVAYKANIFTKAKKLFYPKQNPLSSLEALEKLADLKNKGVITEEEFIEKKAELLKNI
jgi:hypothetical protein